MMIHFRSFMVALFGFIGVNLSANASHTVEEYRLKAAYLYNFASLTKWPIQEVEQNFHICYSGGADTRSGLEQLRGKKIHGMPIELTSLSSLREVSHCNMIFLAKSSQLNPNDVLRETFHLPILTVTDDAYIAGNKELTILIRPEGKRLVFEINHDEATRRQLEISSRLLRLSR